MMCAGLIRKIVTGMVIFIIASMANASSVAEDPAQREMLSIAQKLRCAVCQNQPVSESNSGLARDMRAVISEQLAAGKSESEIIDYFVDRYGDYVLLEPRKSGAALLLWILPPLFLVLAGFFAWLVMRGRTTSESTRVIHKSDLSDEDRERIKRAREEHDKGDE